MSAIGLVWKKADSLSVQGIFRPMLAALREYGPGRQVFWGEDRIALGGNFSDSLPEDCFDIQPLWSEDRSACLVADVRLDNRGDLARELGLVHPEELSDSAFLMAAWLRWGVGCLDNLLGAFAFAVWMPGRKELFAACDHVGERPLFFHRSYSLFALASMPKGLLAIPGFPPGLRESYIADRLANLKGAPTETFYQSIDKLPPGYFLRLTPETFECRQYWHPAGARPIRYKRDEDYAEALLEIFDRATEARLRSTRPIASLLSAGLDSSSVTASAALALARQGKQLTAFTSVPRPGFDGTVPAGYFTFEAESAAELASLYPNIEHLVVDSRGYDFLPTLKRWTGALDQPAVNVVNLLWMSAILGQCEERGIGVLLEAVGGNGTFSYDSWNILNRFLRRGQWIKLARTVYALHRHGDLALTSAARISAGSLMPRWLSRKRAPEDIPSDVFSCPVNSEWMQKYNLKERIFAAHNPAPPSLVEEHSEVFEWSHPGPHIAAIQAMTGIEMRDPTADKRIYDFCFAIPREQFIAAGWSRSLARRAMKDRLPQSILTNCKRGLQDGDWNLSMAEALPEMRSELAILEKSPTASRTLDLQAIRTLLDTWPEAGFQTDAVRWRWYIGLTRAFSMGYFLRSTESTPQPPQHIASGH